MIIKAPLLYLVLLYLINFICFDVIGAILMSVRFFFWMSSDSLYFLAYPLWGVIAVFNGFYFSSTGLAKLSSGYLARKKSILVLIVSLLLSILLLYFFHAFGQMEPIGFDNYWVPGHRGLTLTYFLFLNISVIVYINWLKY